MMEWKVSQLLPAISGKAVSLCFMLMLCTAAAARSKKLPDLNNVSLQTLVENMARSDDKRTFLRKSGLVWEKKTEYHGYYSLRKKIDPVGYREAVIRLKGWEYDDEFWPNNYPYRHFDARKMIKNYEGNFYFSATFNKNKVKSIQVFGAAHCPSDEGECQKRIYEQFNQKNIKFTKIATKCTSFYDDNLHSWTNFYRVDFLDKNRKYNKKYRTLYLMNYNDITATAVRFELVFTYDRPKEKIKKYGCILIGR